MALRYRLGPARRAFNMLSSRAIRLGLAPPSSYLLSTRGRKSGATRTTPVSIVKRDGGRWLVAPYGRVGWVHNVRASPSVSLSRGGRSEDLKAVEASPAEAAPILRAYLRKFPVVRPFFDVKPRDPEPAFVAEAPRHPVFRLEE